MPTCKISSPGNSKRIRNSHVCVILLLLLTIATSGCTWNSRSNGTVQSTVTYESVPGEVIISPTVSADTIILSLNIPLWQSLPYSEIEQIRIQDYSLTNEAGNISFTGDSNWGCIDPQSGFLSLTISAQSLDPGDYILRIEVLEGTKKADAPILISGDWYFQITLLSHTS